MPEKPTRIIIPKTGIATGESQPRAVYDPMSSKVIGALGQVETMRASHVEPGSALSRDALELLYPDFAEREEDHPRTLVIKREYASHWFADMTPTGHDTVLGPYDPDQRDQALADEVKWLHEHNIPTCGPCTEGGAPATE